MNQIPGRLISILYRKNQIYLNAVLKPYNITSSEQPVLMFLYDNKGVTQEEIAHYLQVDKALMTRTIQSLVEKGYVVKEKDQQDKRCNRVSLTEAGIAVREEIKSSLMDWNERLLDGFDEEKRALVFSLFEELIDNLEKKGDEDGKSKSIRD